MSPLDPGIERTEGFEVEGRLLTDVGGTIGLEVLSTPGMVARDRGPAAKAQSGPTRSR